MLSVIIALLVIVVVWKIRRLGRQSILKNFSKHDEVPLMKNSFNLSSIGPAEMFVFGRQCADIFKQSYAHNFFGKLSYNVIRAKDAEKVLGSSKHIDKSFLYNFLHAFLRTGLLTSNGEKWHQRRRMLTPAFHFDILKEFFDVFTEESDKLVETLRQEVDKVIDIVPVSTQFTLNTICESAMGVKLTELGNDGISYRNNIYKIGELLMTRLMRPWLHFDFLYAILGHKKQLDAVLKPVHVFTKSIIEKRRKHFEVEIEKQNDASHDNSTENVYFRSKKRRFAMMDTLLKAQRDGQIDDDGIIEETDTFTFEGHDTTSAAMTFTLLLLAHCPEAQEKMFEEIEENLAGKEELSMDDYNKMEYLDRVVKESMRIYPPVPFISRKFSEDFHRDGVTYPKGSSCHIHIIDIHRDPEFFPDPEKFDPDRFLPENSMNRNNFAFIAFSAGMRNCIGQRFALLELKVMLTKIIANLRVSPITRRDEVVFISDLVLRCKTPIKMMFALRKE